VLLKLLDRAELALVEDLDEQAPRVSIDGDARDAVAFRVDEPIGRGRRLRTELSEKLRSERQGAPQGILEARLLRGSAGVRMGGHVAKLSTSTDRAATLRGEARGSGRAPRARSSPGAAFS
jgi:hypothetical protein